MADTPGTMQKAVKTLVVEDSPTQLATLRFLLKESGFSVVAAANGKEGRKRSGDHAPAGNAEAPEAGSSAGAGRWSKYRWQASARKSKTPSLCWRRVAMTVSTRST